MSQQQRRVISDSVARAIRLSALGLSEESLLNAIRAGAFARATTSTGNYPRCYAGLSDWAVILKTLRDDLLALGWQRYFSNGVEGVTNADGTIVILVESGDDKTGDPSADPGPSTKYSKGDQIEEIVTRNFLLDFGDPNVARINERIRTGDSAPRARYTWFLLHANVLGEIRVELSRPFSIASGFVDEWSERIILASIPPEDARLSIPDDNPVDPDVDVRRRESR